MLRGGLGLQSCIPAPRSRRLENRHGPAPVTPLHTPSAQLPVGTPHTTVPRLGLHYLVVKIKEVRVFLPHVRCSQVSSPAYLWVRAGVVRTSTREPEGAPRKGDLPWLRMSLGPRVRHRKASDQGSKVIIRGSRGPDRPSDTSPTLGRKCRPRAAGRGCPHHAPHSRPGLSRRPSPMLPTPETAGQAREIHHPVTARQARRCPSPPVTAGNEGPGRRPPHTPRPQGAGPGERHSLTRKQRCPAGCPAGTGRPSPCSVSIELQPRPGKTRVHPSSLFW